MAPDAGPEPDDSEIIAVLRLWTDEMDDIALAAFDREVIRLASVVSPRLAVVATEALAGSDPRLRVAAAFALGRCSELAELGLVANIETTLIENAAVRNDDVLMDAIATALLHVWGRSDDEGFATERRYARSPSATLRLASAMSLALSTPEPLPASLVPTVRELSVDPESAVRFWAEDALAYVDERLPDR